MRRVMQFILSVALLAVVACAPSTNARCPYCGTRFRVDGLENMVEFQRMIRFRPCPGCKQEYSLSSYKRTHDSK